MTMTPSQAISAVEAAQSEYFAAAKEAAARGAVIRVTPLDITGIAWLYRENRDLALKMADQSAAQTDGAMK